MATMPLSSRIACLQLPISRIGSLATAIIETINQIGEIEGEEVRTAIHHIDNFTGLIALMARQASDEANNIEVDVEPPLASHKSEA